MTLKPSAIPPIPELPRAIAQAAFPKGNLYLHMRDELVSLYTDELFINVYSEEGQPSWSQWRFALVTVMQFAENLSDHQAADAVRARLDWKYALSLDLTDPGFHYSILSEFRVRLVEHDQGQRLLNKLLQLCQTKGGLRPVANSERTRRTS